MNYLSCVCLVYMKVDNPSGNEELPGDREEMLKDRAEGEEEKQKSIQDEIKDKETQSTKQKRLKRGMDKTSSPTARSSIVTTVAERNKGLCILSPNPHCCRNVECMDCLFYPVQVNAMGVDLCIIHIPQMLHLCILNQHHLLHQCILNKIRSSALLIKTGHL